MKKEVLTDKLDEIRRSILFDQVQFMDDPVPMLVQAIENIVPEEDRSNQHYIDLMDSLNVQTPSSIPFVMRTLEVQTPIELVVGFVTKFYDKKPSRRKSYNFREAMRNISPRSPRSKINRAVPFQGRKY